MIIRKGAMKLALATITSVGIAASAIADDFSDCLAGQPVALDACTRAIQSGLYQSRGLAELYRSRASIAIGRSKHRSAYIAAIADLDEAIRIVPNSAEMHTLRGIMYDNIKGYDQAVTDYSKAIELDPNPNAWRHDLLGRALLGARRYEQAIASYTKAIELLPQESVFWSQRAEAYVASGKLDPAIADYRKALGLSPNDGKLLGKLEHLLKLKQLGIEIQKK